MEQALLKQKSEEEHVTVLLLVLASYINPGGKAQEELVENVLPPNFYKLLSNSVLLPALCSYLRNDSGKSILFNLQVRFFYFAFVYSFAVLVLFIFKFMFTD